MLYEDDDDPISLIYEEFSNYNMQKSPIINDVEDDVDDDPIILGTYQNKKYLDPEIVEIRSSDDENEEHHLTRKSGYGNKNFFIPVTFLDFYRNVKLLKKCKPLSVKVVDCDKHPWYYGYRGTSKPSVNANCLTLGKHSNITKQVIKVEKADEGAVDLEADRVNVEPLITTQSEDDKIQDPEKLNHGIDRATTPAIEVPVTEPKTLVTNYEKLENELEIAKKSKDLSQLNFRRNSGLVGLTISRKDLEPNPEKLAKKKSPKKRKQENSLDKSLMNEIGVTLSNLGTSVTPIPEKRDDNVLNNVTKDSLHSNVTIQDLSYKSSDTRDKLNIDTVSPTRCSLKITSAKILEKLKKAKVQDELKTKSQQKAKKIFTKDEPVAKLSLKRRPTTENDRFYVVDSNKEPQFNNPSKLSQSQEPQKDENAVRNIIHQKKRVESYPPIIPSITITVKNQQKNTPTTPAMAEKLVETQISPSLPNPRTYHKKLKLKKVIESETTTSECSKTPINETVNASDCSLTSGLSQIVVSQVQSLRNLNTLIPNKLNSETPKKTPIHKAKPRHLKRNVSKDIDTAAKNSAVNEKNVEHTHDNKVKKTFKLQQPSISYLQVYNDHVLKILKENEKYAAKQNVTNRQKDIVTATNNNIKVTNQNIPSRDTVKSGKSFNNTAVPSRTDLHIQRLGNQQQLEECFNLNQHHPNTQRNRNDTVNNFPQKTTQVYSHPGKNTVILRKPSAHLQTSRHSSPGHPIQTVVNHRPVTTPKPMARFIPWSCPPPNTNIASNLPCNMPSMNPGNQMYPKYYWEPTNVGSPFPASPLGAQQERNANLIPVRTEVSDDSIIGSTAAAGRLIKKINIGVPASDSTVVNDKQKMLDTLNNAITERHDVIHKPSDPRITPAKIKVKPCPLSKKAVTNPEPHKGYSPPILPIPSFQRAIELVKMKQRRHDSFLSQEQNMDRNELIMDSKRDNCGHRPGVDASKRKLPTKVNKKQDKTKKISIEEYKKRVSKDGVDVNKVPEHKCKRKKVSKNIIDNNQDLGYDSDATLKL